MAIGAIACGAIFMVLSPQPKIKRTTSPPPRPLAYEQRLATPQPEAAPGKSGPPQKEISPVEPLPVEAAPAETAPGETAPAASVETAAPEPDAQDAAAAEESAPDAGAPTADNPASSDETPLPSAENADGASQDRPGPPDQMAAWPREGADPSQPVAPGEGADASDPNAPPVAPGEGADASDPNAPPGEPGEGADEWVQVLVSGAGMYATASDDAPMLFAFPYGRGLKVVSRYQDWVEVTDPQSAATGWMKSSYLAPVAAAPGPPGEVDAGYQDEQPRGWFRRRPGGLADVISRALGGL